MAYEKRYRKGRLFTLKELKIFLKGTAEALFVISLISAFLTVLYFIYDVTVKFCMSHSVWINLIFGAICISIIIGIVSVFVFWNDEDLPRYNIPERLR